MRSEKIFAFAMFAVALFGIAGVLGTIEEYRVGLRLMMFIVLGFNALVALMSIGISLLATRRDAKADSLKAKLISSFREALNASPFNPKRAKEDSRG